MNIVLTLSICLFISGWNTKIVSNCVRIRLNSAGQNFCMNLAWLSDTILSGKLQFLTTCLENSFAMFASLDGDFIGTKVMFLEKWSTTTKMSL